MIRARFRMELPDDIWIADVSGRFPDATFRLLTGVPMGDRTLELGEVRGPDPRSASDALRAHPDVIAYDRLYAGDDRALTSYETTEQGLFEFLGETSIPPEFPLAVEDGAMEFGVTATRSQFDALGESLDVSDLQYTLLSVVHGEARSAVLTDRQRECVTVAVRRGYFEVPRGCTLSEVADALDVDKSTASETLRRAVERVLDWFLVEPT
jgi:predicted DNA binding protein